MDNRPIGVFDSGLGGLTVMREIMERMPNESIVYFGDTGRVPYGTRGTETIIKYVVSDINFLMKFDIKAIVVACGTASSVSLDYVVDKYDLPIIGVVSPTSDAAAKATKNKRIGVLGTSGTINSGSYERALKNIDSTIEVVSKACPLFVPLVENGYLNNEVVRLVAAEYLKPLIEAGVDTIILGCTHYPLLSEVICDIMSADVVLINSGGPTSDYVCELLKQKNMLSNQKAEYKYFVSDDVSNFVTLGSMFLQRHIDNEVSRIEI